MFEKIIIFSNSVELNHMLKNDIQLAVLGLEQIFYEKVYKRVY